MKSLMNIRVKPSNLRRVICAPSPSISLLFSVVGLINAQLLAFQSFEAARCGLRPASRVSTLGGCCRTTDLMHSKLAMLQHSFSKT